MSRPIFRPDYGIEGPFRSSMLTRRRVRLAIVTAAWIAVTLIVLVLAFHRIYLTN